MQSPNPYEMTSVVCPDCGGDTIYTVYSGGIVEWCSHCGFAIVLHFTGNQVDSCASGPLNLLYQQTSNIPLSSIENYNQSQSLSQLGARMSSLPSPLDIRGSTSYLSFNFGHQLSLGMHLQDCSSMGTLSHLDSNPSNGSNFRTDFLVQPRRRHTSFPYDVRSDTVQGPTNGLWNGYIISDPAYSVFPTNTILSTNPRYYTESQFIGNFPLYGVNPPSPHSDFNHLSTMFLYLSALPFTSSDFQLRNSTNSHLVYSQNRSHSTAPNNRSTYRGNFRNHFDQFMHHKQRYLRQPWQSDRAPKAGQTKTNKNLSRSVKCEQSKWVTGMPTELWFKILFYVPYPDRASLARTCRRLSRVVAERHNWLSIRIERFENLTDMGLSAIGRKRPHELHLFHCRGDFISMKGVGNLFKDCGDELRALSLVGCSYGAFSIDFMFLSAALHCKNLTYIDASFAPNIDDLTVETLARQAQCLKTLLLNGAQTITDSAIEEVVGRHQNTLERLELFGCFSLTAMMLPTLGRCHGLRTLALGFMHYLSSDAMLELLSRLPLLSSLDLQGTRRLVTEGVLIELGRACPCVEELVLAHTSAEAEVREEGVVAMLRGLPRLRRLDFCGLALVGDASLAALAAFCPLLQRLDVSCTSVTHSGLLSLVEHPPLNLKALRISFSYGITSEVLEKVVTSCPRLESLWLYGFVYFDNYDFLLNLRPSLVIDTERHTFRHGKVESRGFAQPPRSKW